MPTVVTISASFGAGGSRVGPNLAKRLGVPFVDRAIPASVAARLSVPLEEALAHDERPSGLVERLLASMARMADPYVTGLPVPAAGEDDAERFQAQTESVIQEIATTTGGVLLGRGAVFVLKDRPGVLHARLDGPADRRAAQAAALEGLDHEAAVRMQKETDRARYAYIRHFYKADTRDPSLYHVVLDSTRMPLATCVDMLALAAEALVGNC